MKNQSPYSRIVLSGALIVLVIGGILAYQATGNKSGASYIDTANTVSMVTPTPSLTKLVKATCAVSLNSGFYTSSQSNLDRQGNLVNLTASYQKTTDGGTTKPAIVQASGSLHFYGTDKVKDANKKTVDRRYGINFTVAALNNLKCSNNGVVELSATGIYFKGLVQTDPGFESLSPPISGTLAITFIPTTLTSIGSISSISLKANNGADGYSLSKITTNTLTTSVSLNGDITPIATPTPTPTPKPKPTPTPPITAHTACGPNGCQRGLLSKISTLSQEYVRTLSTT